MPTDPFVVLKKIFKPKTVVSQRNDFYRIYRAAYSDRRLFYKQGLATFFLLLLTAFVGIASYSFVSQKAILGIIFSPWIVLFLFLLLLAFVPLVFFTFKANQITAFILLTILLFLAPIIQLSLKGTIYWQLLIPLFIFVALNLIGIGRMKMVADNQIDFSWWQIGGSGLRYFIYAYLCLIFVFGFWMVKTGAIKQSVNLEKSLTQSVASQFKHILPQINLEGSVDDLLSGIINSQLDSSSTIPGVTTTKPSSSVKTKTTLPLNQDFSVLTAQEIARQKNIILVSTREKLAQMLGISITGKETLFGLIKTYITTKFSTWGPVITSLLVLVLCFTLWQIVNLVVSVIYFFTSIVSYVLLKIFLSTKFFQFKTVNIPHKILTLNED